MYTSLLLYSGVAAKTWLFLQHANSKEYLLKSCDGASGRRFAGWLYCLFEQQPNKVSALDVYKSNMIYDTISYNIL